MARSARSGPKSKRRKLVTREDQRPVSRILPRSSEPGDPNVPIRTVIYVEVGDLPGADAAQICSQILKGFNNGHPHYCAIMRFGKVTSEAEFEGEFLDTVRRLCEVKRGQIVLRDGATDLDIIRRRV